MGLNPSIYSIYNENKNTKFSSPTVNVKLFVFGKIVKILTDNGTSVTMLQDFNKLSILDTYI